MKYILLFTILSLNFGCAGIYKSPVYEPNAKFSDTFYGKIQGDLMDQADTEQMAKWDKIVVPDDVLIVEIQETEKGTFLKIK